MQNGDRLENHQQKNQILSKIVLYKAFLTVHVSLCPYLLGPGLYVLPPVYRLL